MNIILKVFSTAIITLFTVGSLYAQNTLDGAEIINNVYNRPQPNDQQGVLKMILINSRSEERVREIYQFVKDNKSVEKKIMFFTSPADIRNTSFMNWSYSESKKNDDQWIYLPALRKTKRISSEGKSDYFMGSDFTYDDLGDRHPDADIHTLIKEETVNKLPCYVVKSVSKDKDYMYNYTLTWVDKNKFIGVKKEFYDEDNSLLKTLTVSKSKKIGDYWIILESEMHSVQKKHRTKMELSNIAVDQGINDKQFTERTMTRGL